MCFYLVTIWCRFYRAEVGVVLLCFIGLGSCCIGFWWVFERYNLKVAWVEKGKESEELRGMEE